jgi:hypothetical protein
VVAITLILLITATPGTYEGPGTTKRSTASEGSAPVWGSQLPGTGLDRLNPLGFVVLDRRPISTRKSVMNLEPDAPKPEA